ncbi:MAG: GYF domain-containing protein [bacterium]
MKFVCSKCKTKYTISDEKVHGKVLKIRCKNCSSVIEVREPTSGPTTQSAARQTAGQGALKALSRRGGSAAIKRPTPSSMPAAKTAGQGPVPGTKAPLKKTSTGVGARPDLSKPLDTARSARSAGGRQSAQSRTPLSRPTFKPQPSREDEQKTQIAAMPAQLLAEMQRSHRGAAAPPPAAPADQEAAWYLGDDRGEYGPMTFAELAARCKRGEPSPNAEAWREGYSDWLPLEEIPELKPYVKRAPPPRPQTGIRPAPASPYQKTPGKDAAVGHADAPMKRPLAAKVTLASQQLREPDLIKSPAPPPTIEPEPAATPVTEDSWPGVPALPAAPRPKGLAQLDASLSGDLPAPSAMDPAAQSYPSVPAHVSVGTGQADLSPQIAELKRARRPTLLIGAGALLVGIAVVALVVWLISSGKKPGTDASDSKSAQVEDSMKGPPRPATMATPLPAMDAMNPAGDGDDTELIELDIDVSTGMTTRTRRPRRRKKNGTTPKNGMDTPAATSSGSLYGLPTMRAGFVGLMDFGSTSTSGAIASGGARPGDLGSMVRRHYNRLKRCYEKAARLDTRMRNPRLRIAIQVGASGRTRSVYITPTRYQADTIGICIRRSIMQWKWPSFSTSYSYSFNARFHGG